MNKNKTNKLSYLIETIMFFSYAFFAVNWIAGSTLTPEIMKHFSITEFSQATLISNAVTVAKIIGNFLAASILNKLYPKKSIGFGSILIVIGSLIAIFAPTYFLFVIGRFIMGFGGALFVVYFSPVVIEYFSESDRPLINSLNTVCYNIGSILALLLVSPVLKYFNNWKYSLLFFAGISFILFIFWLIFGKDFEIVDKSKGKYTLKDGLKEKIAWVMPLSYFGHLTLYMVMLNIFPISNLSPIDPKTISTLFAVGGVIGTIIAIILSKKLKKRVPIIKICTFLLSILAIFMIKSSNGLIASIFAFFMGVLMYVPLTSFVTIPQELPDMTPARLTQIMSIYWAVVYLLETIAFYFVGVLIDKFSYEVGLYFTIALSFSFFIGSFFLPETSKYKGE
ncbi:MAG: MFS transporter [Anaerococcus vaginalis]|nr:MFS transporter [Anaerococcus vaginalis]MDU7162944.1 MFS transporter [Anaerococcus vaginalis]